jgi:type I restriction-modification system DNA methylase subunit
MKIEEVIDHVRNRSYMGGVERDRLRVKVTGEVFTPTELVREMLEQIPIEQFTDPAKTFLDNSCGDGQFLGEVLIRKIEMGSTFEQALSTTYGVDLMIDNVDLCRERLLCGQDQFRHIVEQNIQCRDGLKFGYNFKPMGPARRNTEKKARAKQEKLKAKQEKLAKLELAKTNKEAQQKKLFGKIIPEVV